jgi:hypothetical protein
MVNMNEDPAEASPPIGEYLVGGQMMTYRQETLRVYEQARSKLKQKPDMPATWDHGKSWWDKLPVNLQLVHNLRHNSWRFSPPKRDGYSVSDRRGQWAQPNLVEVDVSMPYEYTSTGRETAPVRHERVIDYGIPDVEWDELTDEQKQRVMAL